jgi:hypothetical protein
MTLPASQTKMVPAYMIFDPGQIFDFEYTPKAGAMTMEYGVPAFVFPPGQAPKPTVVKVRVQ